MRLLILLFLLFGAQSFETPIEEEIRSKFPYIKDKNEVENYISKLDGRKDVISQGYLASMYFFKSKYVKFPTTKFKFFKRGKELLNSLIEKNPKNIELRYIRYIFQHQIPKFLGYYNDKELDFNILSSSGLEKRELLILLKLNSISEEHSQKINQLLKQ